MRSKKYNKLVRDKTPKFVKQSGKKAIFEKLRDTDMIFHLNLKLREELTEYEDARSVEKIADIVEVLYAILDHKGISRNKFEKLRAKRANKLGAYKEKLFLKEIMEKDIVQKNKLSDASSHS